MNRHWVVVSRRGHAFEARYLFWRGFRIGRDYISGAFGSFLSWVRVTPGFLTFEFAGVIYAEGFGGSVHASCRRGSELRLAQSSKRVAYMFSIVDREMAETAGRRLALG